MSVVEGSYRWMAALLEALFGDFEREACVALLRDIAARETARETLAPRLELAGMHPGTLETTAGDNLFVAVLVLRLKFPLEAARDKVALNIAMREGRA